MKLTVIIITTLIIFALPNAKTDWSVQILERVTTHMNFLNLNICIIEIGPCEVYSLKKVPITFILSFLASYNDLIVRKINIDCDYIS